MREGEGEGAKDSFLFLLSLSLSLPFSYGASDGLQLCLEVVAADVLDQPHLLLLAQQPLEKEGKGHGGQTAVGTDVLVVAVAPGPPLHSHDAPVSE